MRRILILSFLALAACDSGKPLTVGARFNDFEGPLDGVSVTATQGIGLTISGEASIGISGTL